MMLPASVSDQYRTQQAISAATTAAVAGLWRRMGENFDQSWLEVGPGILSVVQAGRAAVVAAAIPYTSAVLQETGQVDDPVGVLNRAAFLDYGPDGRSIIPLYSQSVAKAKTAVAAGVSVDESLSRTGRWLALVTLTTLADTRREVIQADIGQRPGITGYTRMLNPPSCDRCVILAGKWFRWNTGFERHPRCDCSHIPASEDVAGDLRTDPYEYFKSLESSDQEKIFGRLNARAIRDGADIYRVVNVGHRGLATARSAARYGTPSRMTIDDIYKVAGTRTNAIRMMQEQGYILTRGQTVIPRPPGVRTDAQLIAAGRGRGTVSGRTTNRAARFDAAMSGQREVLRRSTMTAAERRLYDAHYRLDQALLTGNVPRSVGSSSADRYATPIPATPARVAELRAELQAEIRLLDRESTPESVRRLARALGLI